MAIKYLGKLRPIDFQESLSYVQMVNCPELMDCQRCAFCHYFEMNRTLREYQACQAKRKCGAESLIFMPMRNIISGQFDILDDFTATPITKQLTIDNQKRYLQLFSSDIQGYECNQLCQYYPARIAGEQTIAECANSHACGRNGSFWNLLTPRYSFLATYPDIKKGLIDENTFITFDGRVLRGVTLDSIYVDANHHPKAVLSDDTSWRIVNMMNESAMAGQSLSARQDSEPRLWEWSFPLYSDLDFRQSLIITSDTEPIAQMLQDYGYPNDNFYRPLKDLTLVRVSSSGASWFVNYETYFDVVQSDGYQIIVLKSFLNGTRYVIKFGSTGATYLAAKFPNETPSQWVKAAVTNFSPSSIHVVTLTSYDDEMAQWLMRIGVRQSLFFFK